MRDRGRPIWETDELILGLFRAAGSAWLVLCFAFAAGCGTPEGESTPKAATPAYPGVSLRIGAFDDSGVLAGVASQRGEWEASRGGKVVMQEGAITFEQAGQAEVLIFPAERLGDLADAGLLETIPNSVILPPQRGDIEGSDATARAKGSGGAAEDGDSTSENEEDPFRYMDIAPVYRDNVIRYGNDRLALPLGSSALVLVYRGDAFRNESNVAAALARGLTLEAPTTWTKLDALAKFFHGRDWDGDGKADSGIAFAMGSDPEGVANGVFLARAASLGQHPDHFSMLFDTDKMSPRVSTPPFVETLQALIALKDFGPEGMTQFSADAARQAFRAGKVAMLIDRCERASSWSSGHPVSVARLPGSERVYEPSRKMWETPSAPNNPTYLPVGGGWVVGVKSGLEKTQREAALDLAKYLANPENSNRIRADRAFPMLPVRTMQMSQGLPDPTSAPDVDVKLWGDAVRRTLMAERVVPGLRIPQADAYLDELAKVRVAAVGGEPAEQALQRLATIWSRRTQAFGPKRQVWNYRRSLNRLITSATPPERGK